MEQEQKQAEVGARDEAFAASARRHVLMITNHGIHEWQMRVGLPDTGGQNVFVNMFSDALAALGFKVTIVNRGGYEHPLTRAWHGGRVYKNDHERILYIEDGEHRFVRKEEMGRQIPRLAEDLHQKLLAEGQGINLILSHYWDAANIGVLLNEKLGRPVPHFWVPHSLGTLKKRNVDPSEWPSLLIDERIAVERKLVRQVDGVAATSGAIRQALLEDYHYSGSDLFLPPCVNPERLHPQEIRGDDEIWAFLASHSGWSAEEIRSSLIMTEVSRTDSTKRKDVVVEVFNRLAAKHPNLFLALTLDETRKELAQRVHQLIQQGGFGKRIALLGSVWEWLPKLYAVSAVYVTPSVMEGFGMSIQEAAATGVPAVASHLVPFATEFLLGPQPREVSVPEAPHTVRWGAGAAVVHADEVAGFTAALDRLLSEPELRKEMGRLAYAATIPRFTWDHQVRRFLAGIGWRLDD